MSTYAVSGTGSHALSSNTTGLDITITTPSVIGGVGRSNPVAKYDQGLIRFSDGTAYWAPVPVLGGPQFIPVPANATSFGYAMLGGCEISVTEVIGGIVFFSGGTQSVETLSDVLVASIADGQILAWNASGGKWENVTPTSSSPLLATHRYAAGSDTSVSTTSTSFVDVDATNQAITFTAPASGNVLIRVTGDFHASNANSNVYFGLREASTNLTNSSRVGSVNVGQVETQISMVFLVTGLTPGSAHTYKLGFRTFNAGTSATVTTGPVAGDTIYEVWAA